ncbi:efflux RND transporter permease subunit [Oceanobacter sp. 4_MG-2023]|jgi:multidrug efflux pump subunit AcrB|uniref:efflux RND transporter permease subunit n=1 Tax=Oceanobacter sp. 4_MG-2023 TaxID=3062623 RepID=UPI0027364FC1|nr:efflux RND transporter permease subunit [Oceanobacter sp. 4_MG-2023]MDP2549188.1 efflux RND transporter permease subunit [Oceanobacter sp. 4_MG-2023]
MSQPNTAPLNAATYFIQHTTTSWMMILILLVGGLISYLGLGRLEDPTFVIKEAMVYTYYPGASPLQVEEEVTARLEDTIQSLPYIKHVDSISRAGLSQIHLEVKSEYPGDTLPQIWDELRRKVNDKASALPPGSVAPIVLDNFGDVFGVLLALTGEGFGYSELFDYAEYLKRELITLDGVSNIDIAGDQQQQVFIDISHEQMTNLGIPLSRLYQLLQTQNSVSNAGHIRVGSEYIRIHPTGEFQSVEELGELLISTPGSDKLIYLKDIAHISTGVTENPTHLENYRGAPSLRLGIAFTDNVNVIEVGERVRAKLAELDANRPLGMSLNTIYDQPAEVDASSQNFVLNLVLSIAIVIAVLLLFMGVRAGLIIGAILLLTILGTFIIMKSLGIDLHRVSLGALIIALGMLVDNALVITEGIMVGLQRGQSRIRAAFDIVKQTQWPLLGATLIAITAFAPIGLSPDSIGEFIGSLFYVLMISLLLSWVTALTLTPFLCNLLFRESSAAPHRTADNRDADNTTPYQGALYTGYRAILKTMLKYRALSTILMVMMMVVAVLGFGQVKQAFFPPSNTPIFLVDIWLPEGSDILATQQQARQLEQWLLQQPGVEFTSSTVGRGEVRFMLTYDVEKEYAAFAQVLVRTEHRDQIPALITAAETFTDTAMPDAFIKFKRLEFSPGTPAKIEARFSGPDQTELRRLAEQAEQRLRDHPATDNIRHTWRERVKVIRPHLQEDAARRAGISRQNLDDLLQLSFSGKQVGIYRESTQLKPIVLRPPEQERLNINNLMDLQIWSPVFSRYIPVQQVVDRFDVIFEDPLILRRDRKRTIEVLADPSFTSGLTANELFLQVRPELEAIPLPPGYQLEWGGEYESSNDARANVFASLPMGYLVMFIITVLLFNELRAALVIWACVPLAIIGVTAGMLLLGAEFGFLSLIGFLSLSGMIVKNGIVLVDQIQLENRNGKQGYDAIFDASVSRLRPVTMAALTTILGMVPLLTDPFFNSMAVVIAFGLGFATILTLGVVPVLYSYAHRVKIPD